MFYHPKEKRQPLREHSHVVYTLFNEDTSRTPLLTYAMLEHLIDGEFEPAVQEHPAALPLPVEKADTAQTIDAQVKTAEWLKELGLDDEEIETKADAQAARKSFASIVTGQTTPNTQVALTQIKTPAAVQHLVGMLTAYDWQFVEQAQELRGYAVAQILEETKHTDARIRLKALDMLGRVTEVALFTERVQIQKAAMSDDELDTRIKDKLNRFMQVVDVIDVSPMDAPRES